MKTTRDLTTAAILAALYTVLTLLQNVLFPGSTSMAIQFRVSEALCVLALFTPAAIYGLSLGCLLSNLLSSAALPLDFLLGTLATALATGAMYALRNVRLFRVPVLSLLMPALLNALIVGAELTYYFGELSFWLNALYVAAGELAVLFVLGLPLWALLEKGRLAEVLRR